MSRLSSRLLILMAILSTYAATVVEAQQVRTIRFATFNITMGLNEAGELTRRLQSGNDEALRKAAAIIQQLKPDVLLLNEFRA